MQMNGTGICMPRFMGSICLFFLMVSSITLSSCDWNNTAEGLDAEEYVQYAGLTRFYTVHLPPKYDGTAALPLVVMLHGSSQNIEDIKYITGFDTVANENSFLALYPLAYENNWNDGRAVAGIAAYDLNVDDVSFITAVMDRVIGSFNVDPNRVYIAGFSNGAMMAHRMAMALPERFAALAAVAGTIPQNLVSMYAPALPVPAVLMHGTEDPVVPYEGGVLNPTLPMGVVLSVTDSAAYWAALNNCSLTPAAAEEPNRNWLDGTLVYRETYVPQTGNSPVVLYRIEGGGHSWPGSPRALELVTDGRISRDIDASGVIWSFFAQYARGSK